MLTLFQSAIASSSSCLVCKPCAANFLQLKVLDILHMKHWGGSGVDFTNLVLILHIRH